MAQAVPPFSSYVASSQTGYWHKILAQDTGTRYWGKILAHLGKLIYFEEESVKQARL